MLNSFLIYYNILCIPLTNNQHISIIQNSTSFLRSKRKSMCPVRNLRNGPIEFVSKGLLAASQNVINKKRKEVINKPIKPTEKIVSNNGND